MHTAEGAALWLWVDVDAKGSHLFEFGIGPSDVGTRFGVEAAATGTCDAGFSKCVGERHAEVDHARDRVDDRRGNQATAGSAECENNLSSFITMNGLMFERARSPASIRPKYPPNVDA